jgi:hypothetical protein
MGWGRSGGDAQALGAIASSSQARFIIIRNPFIDGLLLGAAALGGRGVGGSRSFGRGPIAGDGLGRCGLLGAYNCSYWLLCLR